MRAPLPNGAAAPGRPRPRRMPWVAWAVLGCVVAVTLVIGARKPPPPTTRASHIARLEATLRCPSCVDLSVAASDAPSAIAIRHYVASQVAAGRSDATIIAFLESRYGPSILLAPPKSGSGLAIWGLPVGFVVVVATAMAWHFRRSRPEVEGPGNPQADEALVEAALSSGRGYSSGPGRGKDLEP